MASHRPQRVASQILREISSILMGEAKDPRLYEVQVTDVDVTPDLAVAKIYVDSVGETAVGEILDALERANPFLRHELGQRLRLRRVPSLRFYFDEARRRGQRMDELFEQLKSEGQLGEETPSGE